MPFAALGLTPPLVRVAADQGFTHPTPIQLAAIPAVLQGRDVLGLAQTGSGKTAAFVLPLLQQVLGVRRSTPRPLLVLILVPTRELADQVGGVCRELADGLGASVKVVTAFGGVSINPQMLALRGGADIVVATPGRLLDLVQHNALRLNTVAALVLDEADRLLDLGFAAELAEILAMLPPQRQSLFFSATFADQVQALATALLHEPVRIEVPAEPETRPDITQRAIEVDPPKRAQLLKHLIQTSDWGPEARVLVFAATKYATELVAHKLHRAGIHAAAFHGDLSQGGRRAVLDAFKSHALQVVVATDVAARGIDIVGLPVVVNFDLPRSPDDYIHRIGRTGRAGASGLAISFITPDAEAHFRLIEKRQGLRVPREQIAGFEPVPGEAAELDEDGLPAAPQGLDPNGGVKGKRKSKKDKLREAAARR
ncbi:MAG: DEAD/DEAH box helicase [Aquabacterium sp.]|jgi:ATP-dependent RNA helicase RhlE|uniref:DEAD/DEAH box helicase n=1 Tax=Aquabacterium sp. TaxID=1872578 RepID=UPI001B6B7119|nr:DEAD/DEAH box helicase [Aquabacterium sp.]MBP7132648.1 DEAD/DEAH box helicase [Aquabacterium sp.]MDQ5926690.1 ATP-dependent helicase RhlE [Pseudomonadota bacterium]